MSAQNYTFEELLSKKGYVVYTATGNSMLPLLRARRDIIEIRTLQAPPKKYEVVLYKREEESPPKYILHRVIKVLPNGDYVFAGDHNVYKEYNVQYESLLGVMTRVVRDGKSIYMTDPIYKLYSHVWVDFFPIRVLILEGKKMLGIMLRKLKNNLLKGI